jgi:hypothetical protein
MKILIPVKIYQKLRAYTLATKHEIGGMAKIKRDEKGEIFTIEDLRIFEQVVSGGNVILDYKSQSKFYNELMEQNEDISMWRLWWHSHNTMEAFWSTTDEATIEDSDTENEKDNWSLSLVTNHAGDMVFRCDVFKPLRITVENIPYEILYDDAQIEDEVFKDIVEKVRVEGPAGKKKEAIEPDPTDIFPPPYQPSVLSLPIGKKGGYHWPPTEDQPIPIDIEPDK